MHHAHALVRQLLHGCSGVERGGVLPDTAAEWKQKSGNETGGFRVDGCEFAAKVGGKAAHVHVRHLFQLEPETGRQVSD